MKDSFTKTRGEIYKTMPKREKFFYWVVLIIVFTTIFIVHVIVP